MRSSRVQDSTRARRNPSSGKRRRLLCLWYQTKTEPSAADMLARLRRELLKARLSAIRPGQDQLDQIDDYAWTCDVTAS